MLRNDQREEKGLDPCFAERKDQREAKGLDPGFAEGKGLDPVFCRNPGRSEAVTSRKSVQTIGMS